ncbi:MAG: heme exporter protein CcmD [Proteobacteria bacterium]|nr:heme exporter protein CcmD [Pseudomonadota bacterium]
MEAFLHMGGYARFVWPAYGLAVVIFGWNIWAARKLEREALERARRRLATTRPGESGDAAR